MIAKKSPFKKLSSHKDQKVWRYIDFTKFCDMLATESLFFARADYFDDIFEGSLTQTSLTNRNLLLKEMRKVGFNKSEFTSKKVSDIFKEQKKKVALNCWHLNDNESAAMWKLYLKSNEGIAIQSTYQNLLKVFSNCKESIHLSVVKYIDYEKEFFDGLHLLKPYGFKRKSFEHEKELRGIINSESLINNGGIKIRVGLDQLIENIYVAPNSTTWFTDLVKSVSKKYEYDFDVINSRLDDKPLF